MATQPRPVAPPTPLDRNLKDYTAVIQANMEDLWRKAHSHNPRTTIPTSTEGSVGDIILVNPSGVVWSIYAKVSNSVWLSAGLST